MKRLFGILLFLFLLAVISACNSNEKADGEAAESSNEQVEDNKNESGSSIAGNEIFQKSCISCHSSGDISGGNSRLDSAVIQSNFKTQEELLAFVSERMPMSAPGSLSEEEYEAVVKYLWEQK
ncbi:cytochrome c [Niallia oryzisoli]|uniref:Cytochrome c n=1 Tax=Niallia oryzisoli TaxID=1737571 RepID=A0ABZ2C804_9BACI